MLIAGILIKLDSFHKQLLPVDVAVEYTIEAGSSAHRHIAWLQDQQLIESTFWAKLWLRSQPEMARIKAGHYEILPGTSLSQHFEKMVAGQEKQYYLTLVEGLTFAQWLGQLKQTPNLEFDIGSTASIFQQVLQHNPYCDNPKRSVEGCLLPDTYAFRMATPASEIIKRAAQAMYSKVSELWPLRALDLPYDSPYEALIMASIVEKETGVAAERGVIAGVFVNRLNKNMRLQTDPTVIYGIGPTFDGNLTRVHLRTKTPYNTYTIKGLPPTPIAMPSTAALRASVQPETTDYYYFVARGDGSHQFSTNLADHNKAVRRYQLKRND